VVRRLRPREVHRSPHYADERPRAEQQANESSPYEGGGANSWSARTSPNDPARASLPSATPACGRHLNPYYPALLIPRGPGGSAARQRGRNTELAGTTASAAATSSTPSSAMPESPSTRGHHRPWPLNLCNTGNWGCARPENQTVEDRRTAATVANTVAKPPDGIRRTRTTLEYRPSLRPVTDSPGRLAHSNGSGGPLLVLHHGVQPVRRGLGMGGPGGARAWTRLL
jgi:hypothetical protein